MYLGNVGWNYLQYDGRERPKWLEALDACAATGVPGVELIIWYKESLPWWTPENISAVRARVRELGLRVSQFGVFASPLVGLTSLDADERQAAIDFFGHVCGVAQAVGAPLVNFVSPWPQGITAASEYIPRNYVSDATGGHPKLSLRLPPGFDWQALWDAHVQVMKECTRLAREHGLKLALEGHLHVMTPGTDGLLRLMDHVGDDALGVNLDIGWHALQREEIAWSIHKLGKRLLNVHLRDIDGWGVRFAAPGHGVLHWPSIVAALRAVGYDGALNLEHEGYGENSARAIRWTFEYMKEVLEAGGVTVSALAPST